MAGGSYEAFKQQLCIPDMAQPFCGLVTVFLKARLRYPQTIHFAKNCGINILRRDCIVKRAASVLSSITTNAGNRSDRTGSNHLYRVAHLLYAELYAHVVAFEKHVPPKLGFEKI